MTEIPLLRAEVLAGYMTQFDVRDMERPLFRYFRRPDTSETGDKIQLRVRRPVAQASDFADIDAPATLVKTGGYTEAWVEPWYIRNKTRLKNSDVSLFRSAGDPAQLRRGQERSPARRAADRRLFELLEELGGFGREALHAAMAGTLQGSYTGTVDGVPTTVNFNLTSMSAPGATWNDTSAPIIDNLYEGIEEFSGNAGGRTPTHVFYNPTAWVRYFIKNVQFKSYIGAVPGLAQAFAGVRGGQSIARADGSFIDPFFGLIWQPIKGSYVDADGNTVLRWPVNKFSLAALDGPARVLGHEMISDLENPDPREKFETLEYDDPKGYAVRHTDNGAPAIWLHDRVQPWTVGDPE